MSERNMGQVVPFQVNAARLRRGAQEHHRRGRPVEAVELLRHAAVKEDSAAGWLHLAEQLRRLGCYELASALLYRLLAREDAPIRAWLELAYAQHAMGQTEATQDSVYHYLSEDPYSDVADEARALLEETDADEDSQQPMRLMRLVHRGLVAWQEGEEQLGERRLRRAIRLSGHPEKLQGQLAALLLRQERVQEALSCMLAAYRANPEDVRIVCALSILLESMGKRRMALGLLQAATPCCASTMDEEVLLEALKRQQAWETYEALLMESYRQQPCSIRLLLHMAQLQWHKGQKAEAEAYLQRILRLDPDDAYASSLLAWMAKHDAGEPMQVEGIVAENTLEMLKQVFDRAIRAELTPSEMLEHGTESRRAVDWCFEISDQGIQRLCLEMLLPHDTPAIRQYLRELLTSPTVQPDIKQAALLRLTQMGETGKLRVLVGQRMTEAECRPMPEGEKHLWQIFLGLLLVETRKHRQSAGIASCAAGIWAKLSLKQRQRAVGPDALAWVKAIEICYLSRTGQEQAAQEAARNMKVSQYRVGRVIRQIGPIFALENKAEE